MARNYTSMDGLQVLMNKKLSKDAGLYMDPMMKEKKEMDKFNRGPLPPAAGRGYASKGSPGGDAGGGASKGSPGAGAGGAGAYGHGSGTKTLQSCAGWTTSNLAPTLPASGAENASWCANFTVRRATLPAHCH